MDLIPTTYAITNYVKNLLTINNELAAAEGTNTAPIWDQLDKHDPNLLIFLNNFDNEIPEKKEIELKVGVAVVLIVTASGYQFCYQHRLQN